MRAQSGIEEFKGGIRVIIQTSDDARIDQILNLHRLQVGLHLLKVFAAVLIKVVQLNRCLGGYAFAMRYLAIQQAARLGLQTGLTIRTKLSPVGFKILYQRLVIFLAAAGTAHAVDFQIDVFKTQFVQESDLQGNNLRIVIGMAAADALQTVLIELAVSALLGTVIAEHRSQIIEPGQARLRIQMVFHIAAHHRRCAFRTQGKIASLFILKAVHLFLNNV